MTYRTQIHHRLPAHRQQPVPHAVPATRAYRLGRCQMLAEIGRRLADHTCTLAALRREIEEELVSIVTAPPDPTDTPGDHQLHDGQATACCDCLDFLADRRSSRATFAVHIICMMVAAFPHDYQVYLQRGKARSVEDPALSGLAGCLDLPEWYAAVDALHAEIDRTLRAGLPPSARQQALADQLLWRPGERPPCAH